MTAALASSSPAKARTLGYGAVPNWLTGMGVCLLTPPEHISLPTATEEELPA